MAKNVICEVTVTFDPQILISSSLKWTFVPNLQKFKGVPAYAFTKMGQTDGRITPQKMLHLQPHLSLAWGQNKVH